MSQKEKALSKFTILCWAAFTAFLGHMRPVDCGLDAPLDEKIGVSMCRIVTFTLKICKVKDQGQYNKNLTVNIKIIIWEVGLLDIFFPLLLCIL